MKKLLSLVIIIAIIAVTFGNLFGSIPIPTDLRAHIFGDKYSFFVTNDYKLIVYNNQLNHLTKEIVLPGELTTWISNDGFCCLCLVKDANNAVVENKILLIGINKSSIPPYYCWNAYVWVCNISNGEWQKINQIGILCSTDSFPEDCSRYGILFIRYSSPQSYGINVLDYSLFI